MLRSKVPEGAEVTERVTVTSVLTGAVVAVHALTLVMATATLCAHAFQSVEQAVELLQLGTLLAGGTVIELSGIAYAVRRVIA